MRTATLADVDLIKSILLASFKNDPHLAWLLEESKNKFKLNVLIDYVVHQTLRRGEIYLTTIMRSRCGILSEMKRCHSIIFGGT